MKARTADIQLFIAGVDATKEISPGLLSFTYTDHASEKSDELVVSLEDRDHLWIDSWKPVKGDKLEAVIVVRDWFAEGKSLSLPCGSFEIDEFEVSGPPDVVRIKACSTPVNSSLRREKKTASWEQSTLQLVASDIAGQNGLGLLYEAPAIQIKRVDQREESDLQFLQRLSKKYGLNLKVSDTQVIIFSGEQYDAKAPVASLIRGASWIRNFTLRDQAHEQYKDCQVSYWDPEKKDYVSQTFSVPGAPPSGQTLKINERIEDPAEAQAVAQKRLREANKSELEVNFDLAGHPLLVAGSTVLAQGFGFFDGNYFIEKAVHSISRNQGYVTKISVRWTLEY
jgi:phage protein D